jgi:carbamoyl-phosphate synthase small subunit
VKYNILRRLDAYGCDVHVFPASAPASELKAIEPDGIFLSNGPGDPAALPYAIATSVNSSTRPTSVCSASALVTRSWAWPVAATPSAEVRPPWRRTIPVKELHSVKVEITSQNHGFAVDPGSLPSDVPSRT